MIEGYSLKKIFVLVLFVLLSKSIFAQTAPKQGDGNILNSRIFNYDMTVGLSFTSHKIMTSGINTAPILSRDTAVNTIGGSFNGAMPGIELRFNKGLDKNGDMRLTFGADYQFFSARERVPISKYVSANFENKLNILSPFAGINYTLYRIPAANAFIEGGLEFRGNYFHSHMFIRQLNYDLLPELNEREEVEAKAPVWRFGPVLRLSIQGEIFEDYYLNLVGGYAFLNAFGKDNTRGELMTPSNDFETQESAVNSFLFSLSIQYRL